MEERWSFEEMARAREGVVVLLNDVWHSAVVKSGYVSSRIQVFKNEGKGEERNRFWNDSG